MALPGRAKCCREQVQQILEANSSNVMRNNRPLWLVDSSKTLYVAHRQVAQLARKLPIKRERAEVLASINWQH